MQKIPLQFGEFKDFLLSLSPQDEKAIKEFCDDLHEVIDSKMPSGPPSNPAGLFVMLRECRGFLRIMRKYMVLTMEDFAGRFENKLIKELLFDLMPPEYSASGLFMMLGSRMNGNAGYPLGGAWEVIRRVEDKYRKLGGVIHFASKVDQIVVEKGRVTGIRSKGDFYGCEAVIAACDMHDTLYRMLGGKYPHEQLDSLLESAPLFDPIAVVSFGLKNSLGIPYSYAFDTAEEIETAPGIVISRLEIRSYDFDPSAAPQNGSTVMAYVRADLDYWQKLRTEDMEGYRAEKHKLAQKVASEIDKRFPGFSEEIEVEDIATPATYIRYANLYKASWEGFAPTPAALKVNIKRTVKGVKGLILAGQWITAGGGLCMAVKTGKDAAAATLRRL